MKQYFIFRTDGLEISIPVPEMTELQKLDNLYAYNKECGAMHIVVRKGNTTHKIVTTDTVYVENPL